MLPKFLIVSGGSIGRRHLQNLRELKPEAQIGVLHLHTTPEGAESLAGADHQFFSIEEALLFEPDAAIIASPATVHLQVALHLVRASIPLMIEKPIADRCEGLNELIRNADERGLVVMVAYNLRFMSLLREAKRLLESGALGTVMGVRAEVGQYLPTWRPESRYQDTVSAQRALGGGALLELSHEIDYLYWMFGLPASVSATGGRFSDLEIDVEDMVSLSLEYEKPSRLVQVHLDMLQQPATRVCKFICSRGTLVWDCLADQLRCFDLESGEWREIHPPGERKRNESYVDELCHFLECVDDGHPSVTDARQAYDVLAVIEAARKSIKERKVVRVRGYGDN